VLAECHAQPIAGQSHRHAGHGGGHGWGTHWYSFGLRGSHEILSDQLSPAVFHVEHSSVQDYVLSIGVWDGLLPIGDVDVHIRASGFRQD
jgi:hypothetical protein